MSAPDHRDVALADMAAELTAVEENACAYRELARSSLDIIARQTKTIDALKRRVRELLDVLQDGQQGAAA